MRRIISAFNLLAFSFLLVSVLFLPGLVSGQSASSEQTEVSSADFETDEYFYGSWVCTDPTFALEEDNEVAKKELMSVQSFDYINTPLVFKASENYECLFGTSDNLERHAWLYENGQLRIWSYRPEGPYLLEEMLQREPMVVLDILNQNTTDFLTTLHYSGVMGDVHFIKE